MNVPLWGWTAVMAVVLAMLAVDLIAHRRAHEVGLREAAAWSALWVIVALGFGGVLWAGYGADAAGQYLAGYLIEKSLAVDNVFVFALIFASLGVPRAYQHRVLFFGVLGALVLRAGFIAGGAVLIERFHWVLYVFGAVLVITGIRMLRHRNPAEGTPTPGTPTPGTPTPGTPIPGRTLSLLRRVMPVTDTYDGPRFFTRRNGALAATPLFAALVMVETADVVFAVDSIPAVFAVTREPFLVFTSNVFAILGLRAMYFLLGDLMHRFVYLKTGLAVILVAVGVKMLLLDVYPVPIPLSLGFIVLTLTICVVASLRATRNPATAPPTAPPTPPPTPHATAGRPR